MREGVHRMERDIYKAISDTALRKRPADLVLKNARVVDVFTGEIRASDVAVTCGMIAAVGDSYEGQTEEDLEGRYVLPGFIDAHLHLESAMVTPNELVTEAARHGTTTFIVDPHEAANVCGSAGIDYILDQTEDSPANVYVMLPSCVPATEYDDNGGCFTADMMKPYISNPRVLGLGEVMDVPGVVQGDPALHAKLELFRNMTIDGHAPSLTNDRLSAYAAAGIRTDHEATSYEYALEEVRRGLHVHIREGSAARNLEDIVRGIVRCHLPTGSFSFCTDDKHIEDIMREGHIDHNVRKAVALGINSVEAIQMATINAARTYGLHHLGAVAPGRQADFVITDDLTTVTPLAVYHKGKKIEADGGVRPCPAPLKDTVHAAPVTAGTFRLPVTGGTAHVIRLEGSSITTENIVCRIDKTENYIPRGTFNKIAAVERHRGTGLVGTGICDGYGISGGAVASSVSHDSHNIIVIGDNDCDMALAVNAIIAEHGGYALVRSGAVFDTLPLPIMGLMSDAGFESVEARLKRMIEAAHSMGVPRDIDPFITLSFLALPVIPALRVTPRGVLDTVNFKYVHY